MNEKRIPSKLSVAPELSLSEIRAAREEALVQRITASQTRQHQQALELLRAQQAELRTELRKISQHLERTTTVLESRWLLVAAFVMAAMLLLLLQIQR